MEPNRPTAVLALLVGAGVLAAGGGIALPHLSKGGPVGTTAVGLVFMALGVALVGLGALGLLRPVKRWWQRALVVAAMLVALLLAGMTVGVAVAATNVPPTDVGDETPAEADLAFEDVTFDTADGVTLSGWYMPAPGVSAGGDHPGVVLLHGAGSTRSATLDHAAVLVGRGYSVLALDARGHGLSEGRAMDLGWYGDEDVTAAIDALVGQPGVDEERIAVVGLSMGGEEAIGAIAVDPRIAAVVAEGATGRTSADQDWLSEVHGWRGQVQEWISWVTFSLADLLTGADSPTPLLEAVTSPAAPPVLLIAGGAVADEVDVAEHLRTAAPDRVEVWEAPGSGHIGALGDHPREWADRVDSFLDGAFRTGSSGGG